MGPGFNYNFVYGKSSRNIPKPVVIFWSSIPCVLILSVYALLKVVGYYDLRVMSMSVMGFPKKKFGWMGVSSNNFFLDFWNCFNFAKPLRWCPSARSPRIARLR